MIERIVLVTKKTEYTELVERFANRNQARFRIDSSGGDFGVFENENQIYENALNMIRAAVPEKVRYAEIDLSYVPTYLFDPNSLVMTLGPDGLVVNVAKYLAGQPMLAFTPDPRRIGGVLAYLSPQSAEGKIRAAMRGELVVRKMTMAEAVLNDGQKLLATNDLFIGPRSHTSARYKIRMGSREEVQSSSGIIVSTGVGSSGWYRSIVTGALGISLGLSGASGFDENDTSHQFPWDANELRFSVREPFPSRTSQATLIYGSITRDRPLVIESNMPREGVIFSDGIESDYIEFNAGSIATIGLCARQGTLLV